MSKLEYYSRPLVAFDASNKTHRRYYHEFLVKRAWGHCPVRFIVPDEHGSLIELIQQSLLKYYLKREFGEVDY